MDLRIIIVLILSVGSVLLPKQSGASRDSLIPNIWAQDGSDLPSETILHAWHDKAVHFAPNYQNTSRSSGFVTQHTCTGLLRYTTDTFRKQAKAATKLLDNTHLGNGHYVNIVWVHEELNRRTFVQKEDYTKSYKHNAPNDASSEYCVVLQEV